MAGRSWDDKSRAGLVAVAFALVFGGCAGPGGTGALTGEPIEPASGAATMAVESQEIAPADGAVATQPAPAATAATPAPAQPTASGPSAARPQRDGTLIGSGKPKEPAYPNFGTPAQIGQTPVMTEAQRGQMQTDLETMAKEREAQARRELEEEDQGQP